MKSDPRLAWIMLQYINTIYMDLKHQETLQASISIQNLKSPVFSSPSHPYQPSEINLPVNLQEVHPT